jgi:nitric oxide reductase activation protein
LKKRLPLIQKKIKNTQLIKKADKSETYKNLNLNLISSKRKAETCQPNISNELFWLKKALFQPLKMEKNFEDEKQVFDHMHKHIKLIYPKMIISKRQISHESIEKSIFIN